MDGFYKDIKNGEKMCYSYFLQFNSVDYGRAYYIVQYNINTT